MTGIIVLDKPSEFTSFDAVAVLRGLTGERKAGHTGTLDPMATGVLPLLFGRATKAIPLLPDTDKSYEAGFRLGLQTDTGDIWGRETASCPVNVSKEAVELSIAGLRGDILQLPPMYSAVSVNGKRLYELARKGLEVQREKRPVHIAELSLCSFNGKEGILKISCSKGTYIRTLIEDMAKAAGSLGTMTSLRRSRACGFSLEESHSLDKLKGLKEKGAIEEALLPVEMLFKEYPTALVSQAQEQRFLNGGSLDLQRLKLPRIALCEGELMQVYREEFLGLGRIDLEENCLSFVKQFKLP